MLYSVILWFLISLVDWVIIMPLTAVGSFLDTAWVSVFASGLAYVLAPLMYLQAFIDVPMAYRSIGWCVAVFFMWIVWQMVKFVANWLRGTNVGFDKVGEIDTSGSVTGDNGVRKPFGSRRSEKISVRRKWF